MCILLSIFYVMYFDLYLLCWHLRNRNYGLFYFSISRDFKRFSQGMSLLRTRDCVSVCVHSHTKSLAKEFIYSEHKGYLFYLLRRNKKKQFLFNIVTFCLHKLHHKKSIKVLIMMLYMKICLKECGLKIYLLFTWGTDISNPLILSPALITVLYNFSAGNLFYLARFHNYIIYTKRIAYRPFRTPVRSFEH